MKHFILLVLSLCTISAHASTVQKTVDVSALSSDQLAKVQEFVRNADQSNIESMTEKVQNFSKAAAQGVISFAKELGVAANEFINTPAGKVVAFIVFMKFFGVTVMHSLVGAIFLFIVFPISFRMFIKYMVNGAHYVTEYDNIPVLGGLYIRKVPKTVKENHSDSVDILKLVLAILSGASLVVGLVNIFG